MFPLLRSASAVISALVLAGLVSSCASDPYPRRAAAQGRAPTGFAAIPYAAWRDDDPGYRLYPGDQVDVATPAAPELNRSVTVGLDGRIQLPLVGGFMAADRTVPQLEQVLSAAYASQLIDPRVEVSVKTALPLRIFVGGEVGKPGVYDMPGDIDALQASVMAGGFLTSADTHRVVVIRRGFDGRAMAREVDLGDAVRHAARADAVPLRRFDIIYVPRSGISGAGLFVQQYLRDLVPVQFSYATGSNGFLSTR